MLLPRNSGILLLCTNKGETLGYYKSEFEWMERNTKDNGRNVERIRRELTSQIEPNEDMDRTGVMGKLGGKSCTFLNPLNVTVSNMGD